MLSPRNKTRIAFALIGVLLVFAVWQAWNSRGDRLRFKVRGDQALVYGKTDGFSQSTMRSFIKDHP